MTSPMNPPHLAATPEPGEPDAATSSRDHATLERMRGELWLTQRVLQVERERVAQLAEQRGYHSFAVFLRDRAERERMPLSE